MGDNFGDGSADELPVHNVCLSDFYIDKYEVTQSEYQSAVGTNPAEFKSCGGNCPVEMVTWNDASAYCAAVGRRLPTEAEWEYAARSRGQLQKYAGTSNVSTLNNYAWYGLNTVSDSTHPVGQKLPNGLGIYDMSGNIGEFVSDWYDSGYYAVSPANNPQGPSSGTWRVLRGGAWHDGAGDMRAAKRDWLDPTDKDYGYGIRCARTK